MTKSRYEPAYDGLRALGIAAVMGFHYQRGLVPGGALGVDVFFTLSGWLITGVLLRDLQAGGRIDYRAFLTRRVWRLLPPLLALVVAYAVLAPWLIPRAAAGRWVDIAATLGFVSNLRETFWPRANPLSHLWFLSLQIQFYLVWPPILSALLRLKRETAALVLVGVWAALTAARVVWNETIGGPGPYYFTPLHATGLILGAALALRPLRVGRAGWPALALLVGLILFADSSRHFLLLPPIVEWTVVLLLAGPPGVLRTPPLPFLGRISYGVYLWHVPFMWIVPPTTPMNLALLVAASLAAGWLSYRFIEQPTGKARRPAAAAAPP